MNGGRRDDIMVNKASKVTSGKKGGSYAGNMHLRRTSASSG